LLVEGDFQGSAEAWRSLQASRLPPAAAADARFLAEPSPGRFRPGCGRPAGPGFRLARPAGPVRARPRARCRRPACAGNAGPGRLCHGQPAGGCGSVARHCRTRAERPNRARQADATARGLATAEVRPLEQRLLEVRAQALAGSGDNESAFDAHRQVLALATSSGSLGEQLFRLAQASRDLGKPDAAVQALQTALDQFPSSSTTADALRLLDDLGAASQIDPFVLGRARYFAVDYRNAVAAFDRYLSIDPNGPDAPSARLFRALASLTPGNEPNALRELDAIADDPNRIPSSPRRHCWKPARRSRDCPSQTRPKPATRSCSIRSPAWTRRRRQAFAWVGALRAWRFRRRSCRLGWSHRQARRSES